VTYFRRAENFKSVFSKFDRDSDGKLTYDEFSRGLKQLGLILPEKEVLAIWGGRESSNNHDKGVKWQAMEEQIADKSKILQSHGRSPTSPGAMRQVRACCMPAMAHSASHTGQKHTNERHRLYPLP
jgi:hypothetical protein